MIEGFADDLFESFPNLVPRVLTYPPYGARERERESLSLSLSVGRVGENPGNEVDLFHL